MLFRSEAVDWYIQRIDASNDNQLKDIIKHSMLEEVEHASKTLEWLRTNVPEFNSIMSKYLFKDKILNKED